MNNIWAFFIYFFIYLFIYLFIFSIRRGIASTTARSTSITSLVTCNVLTNTDRDPRKLSKYDRIRQKLRRDLNQFAVAEYSWFLCSAKELASR